MPPPPHRSPVVAPPLPRPYRPVVPPARSSVVRRAAAPSAQRSRLRPLLALVALVAAGVLLRAWNLGHRALWVDEAESSLNALAILESGLPRGTHQGRPVFESVLTRPWPGSAEFEFADSSYSRRNLAIFHGWLPLYAIAAAYAAAGVRPQPVPEPLEVVHDARAIRLRTIAGRVPAVLFGAALLGLMFLAGRALGGAPAGWAALAAAVAARPLVEYARQARYFSATVALTAACLLALWLALRRGRWRDVLACAGAYVLLFHTHAASFAAAGGALLIALPLARPAPRRAAKAAAFCALVAAGTLPWMAWVGYFDTLGEVPAAWRRLDLPGDLLAYARVQPHLTALLGLLLALAAAAALLRPRLPARLREALAAQRGAAWLLAGWMASGWLAFHFALPAASFFVQRLTLVLIVPALLLGALAVGAAARAVAPRRASLLAGAVALPLAAVAGRPEYPWLVEAPRSSPALQAVEHLRALGPLPSDTRIYATPCEHLPLAWYSGLPVQSVAPVRKEFLDSWPGPLLVIEAYAPHPPVPSERLRAQLAARDLAPGEAAIAALRVALSTRLAREDLARRVASVSPPLEPLPDFAAALLAQQRAAARFRPGRDNPAVFGSIELPDRGAWWPAYIYCFVDPDARSGERLNYARRAREARAEVLPCGWAFLHCPPRDGGAGAGAQAVEASPPRRPPRTGRTP